MVAKLTLTLSLLFFICSIYSQGHIDHIKNQGYLKFKDKVDCNNLPGDNLSERICANLAFQKSDSLLVVVQNELLTKAKGSHIDSLKNKIIAMQVSWRTFRDQHCSIIYDSFKNCGSCHLRAIEYLRCLKELTDDRIKELSKLNLQLEGQ